MGGGGTRLGNRESAGAGGARGADEKAACRTSSDGGGTAGGGGPRRCRSPRDKAAWRNWRCVASTGTLATRVPKKSVRCVIAEGSGETSSPLSNTRWLSSSAGSSRKVQRADDTGAS